MAQPRLLGIGLASGVRSFALRLDDRRRDRVGIDGDPGLGLGLLGLVEAKAVPTVAAPVLTAGGRGRELGTTTGTINADELHDVAQSWRGLGGLGEIGQAWCDTTDTASRGRGAPSRSNGLTTTLLQRARLHHQVTRTLPLTFALLFVFARNRRVGPSDAPVEAPSNEPASKGGAPPVGRDQAKHEEAPPPSIPCRDDKDCPKEAAFRDLVTLYGSREGTVPLVFDGKTGLNVAMLADLPADGSRAQVVCLRWGLAVRVFVEQDALHPVLVEHTTATASPEGSAAGVDPRVGLFLLAGTTVNVRQTLGARVEIAVAGVGGKWAGWVDETAVGLSYDRHLVDWPARPTGDSIELVWASPVVLLDRPGGRAIATVDGYGNLRALGPKREGHALVSISPWVSGGVHAVGWIHDDVIARASSLRRSPPTIGGVVPDGLAPGSSRPPPRVLVPKGTQLQSDGGETVGITEMAGTLLPCLADCETDQPVVEVRCVANFPARGV